MINMKKLLLCGIVFNSTLSTIQCSARAQQHELSVGAAAFAPAHQYLLQQRPALMMTPQPIPQKAQTCPISLGDNEGSIIDIFRGLNGSEPLAYIASRQGGLLDFSHGKIKPGERGHPNVFAHKGSLTDPEKYDVKHYRLQLFQNSQRQTLARINPIELTPTVPTPQAAAQQAPSASPEDRSHLQQILKSMDRPEAPQARRRRRTPSPVQSQPSEASASGSIDLSSLQEMIKQQVDQALATERAELEKKDKSELDAAKEELQKLREQLEAQRQPEIKLGKLEATAQVVDSLATLEVPQEEPRARKKSRSGAKKRRKKKTEEATGLSDTVTKVTSKRVTEGESFANIARLQEEKRLARVAEAEKREKKRQQQLARDRRESLKVAKEEERQRQEAEKEALRRRLVIERSQQAALQNVVKSGHVIDETPEKTSTIVIAPKRSRLASDHANAKRLQPRINDKEKREKQARLDRMAEEERKALEEEEKRKKEEERREKDRIAREDEKKRVTEEKLKRSERKKALAAEKAREEAELNKALLDSSKDHKRTDKAQGKSTKKKIKVITPEELLELCKDQDNYEHVNSHLGKFLFKHRGNKSFDFYKEIVENIIKNIPFNTEWYLMAEAMIERINKIELENEQTSEYALMKAKMLSYKEKVTYNDEKEIAAYLRYAYENETNPGEASARYGSLLLMMNECTEKTKSCPHKKGFQILKDIPAEEDTVGDISYKISVAIRKHPCMLDDKVRDDIGAIFLTKAREAESPGLIIDSAIKLYLKPELFKITDQLEAYGKALELTLTVAQSDRYANCDRIHALKTFFEISLNDKKQTDLDRIARAFRTMHEFKIKKELTILDQKELYNVIFTEEKSSSILVRTTKTLMGCIDSGKDGIKIAEATTDIIEELLFSLLGMFKTPFNNQVTAPENIIENIHALYERITSKVFNIETYIPPEIKAAEKKKDLDVTGFRGYEHQISGAAASASAPRSITLADLRISWKLTPEDLREAIQEVVEDGAIDEACNILLVNALEAIKKRRVKDLKQFLESILTITNQEDHSSIRTYSYKIINTALSKIDVVDDTTVELRRYMNTFMTVIDFDREVPIDRKRKTSAQVAAEYKEIGKDGAGSAAGQSHYNPMDALMQEPLPEDAFAGLFGGD